MSELPSITVHPNEGKALLAFGEEVTVYLQRPEASSRALSR